MKSKDQRLLEEAYLKIVREQNEPGLATVHHEGTNPIVIEAGTIVTLELKSPIKGKGKVEGEVQRMGPEGITMTGLDGNTKDVVEWNNILEFVVDDVDIPGGLDATFEFVTPEGKIQAVDGIFSYGKLNGKPITTRVKKITFYSRKVNYHFKPNPNYQPPEDKEDSFGSEY